MRFMMVIFRKDWPDSNKPVDIQDREAFAEMGKYNDQLKKAGILLAMDGLTPPSMGARVTYQDGKSKVTDGPFTEAKEAIAGYWMIEVKSREEALEWAS
ncbi:MAG TPA: YciI family protein, partial [Chthoniobacterales bacterium]